MGNLLSRTVNMIGRYFDGAVPASQPAGEVEQEVLAAAKALSESATGLMETCQFHHLIDRVLGLADATNRYIDVTAPFKLAKDPAAKERLGTILYTCAEAVRLILLYLSPFMPVTAAKGLQQLGWPAGPAGPARRRRLGRPDERHQGRQGRGALPSEGLAADGQGSRKHGRGHPQGWPLPGGGLRPSPGRAGRRPSRRSTARRLMSASPASGTSAAKSSAWASAASSWSGTA